MSRLAAPLLFILLAATAAHAQPRIERIADTVIDPRALYLPDGRWGHTTNGRTFQQEAIASFNGYQYATHFDADRKLCLARRKLDDPARGDWQVIRFDDYTFKGNDTHNAPVLGVCPADGTIHLAFDHHGHPLRYRVSRAGVATDPAAIKWSQQLFGPTVDALEPGKPIARVTYPRFITTPDGNLQFQCRIGGSGNGDAYLADYRDGRWSNFAPFISGAGQLGNSKSRNAYENGYTYGRDGALHVTWCWRESVGGPMSNHDLCYARSDDRGLTWRNDAGDIVATRGGPLLITAGSPGVVGYAIPQRRGLINSTCQALDGRGRVHVVTRHLPDDVAAPATWEETRKLTRFFHYWRDDAGRWQRSAMPFGGSRGQLCFDRDDNAYTVFVSSDNRLCLAAAAASKRWSDWRILHREELRFTDQPCIDAGRARDAGLLSVYIQQSPQVLTDTASPLHAIDYRLGP